MRNVFYLLILLFVVSFTACNDDFENYTHSPGDILSFSADTIRFDTILSTVNTPYMGLMVYNKNKDALLVSSIRLKNAGESGFKINVDGMAGDFFSDVEIRSNDSLYIFVDVKPDRPDGITPVLLEDCIEFVTNTVTQTVTLESYIQDVEILRSLVIESDTVLYSELPFLVYDSLYVKPGAVLEIPEGTILYMHGNTHIIVDGTLKIKGTHEKPVIIRGDRMDILLGEIPYDRVPGQWGGIRFGSESYHNEIEHAHIRNGNYGLCFELSQPEQPKLLLRNSILTNCKGNLIQAVNCNITVENCELSNSKDALVELTGGAYSFTHCTLANFYSSNNSGWGSSENRTLILNNTYILPDFSASELYPITKADFKNTIFWGLNSRLSPIRIEENQQSAMVYFFQNCLIQNKGENDNDFVNCLFAKDPLFKKIKPRNEETDTEDFIYDFHLTEKSPALNAASRETAGLFPKDLDGYDRLSDSGPDIGAYELH